MKPPRLARWLMDRALPRDARGDAMRGDLLEEFRTRDGRRASLWYWRHSLGVALRYAHVPRTEHRIMWLESTWQDVRYAVRSYRKAPTFTVTAIATLALGIGASTAIFSMVNGILLHPLPLPEPDRLAYITEINPKGGTMSVSWPNYLDWRERVTSFDALALSRDEPLTLTGVDAARRIRARRITANFFRVVGIGPAVGRGLTDADDRPNAAAVAIVSDGFWRAQLGTDPGILGRIVTLNDVAYTVIGVMPRGFEYLRPYDAFVSMGPIAGSRVLMQRGNHNGFNALGRLKAGRTIESAATEIRSIAASLEREYPNTNSGVSTATTMLADQFVSGIRLTLLALFGAVGFLLLMACVNVANLLIARGAARQHELAVRTALGGGRLRLIRQLLIESTVLSIVGGILGISIAVLLVKALVAGAPDGTPRINSVTVDRTAMLFAIVAAAASGIAFGAFPALQMSGVDGQQALGRTRGGGATARSHRLRRGLIVVETALAIVLLTGAGLMIRTVQRLTNTDPGFRTDHLLTTRFSLSGKNATSEALQPVFSGILSRVRALPGVASAGLTYSLPIDGSQWNSVFIVSGKPVPDRAQLKSSAFTDVSAGFFETMDIHLLRGRTFSAEDAPTTPRVIVVNERFAKELWPGEDAVGKRVKQGWPEDKTEWREVVGVVADVKLNGLAEDPPLQVYIPLTQDSAPTMALVVRTTVDPLSIVPTVDAAAHQLNKDMPLYLTRSMDQILSTSIARQRMSVLIFATFALVALVLAAVGLYGVVAQSVTERTHEIGVRMALGAGQRHVLALVVRQGLSMAVLGVAVGVTIAVGLSRSIQGLLFGVTATDPPTFGAVIVALLAVAALACYVPAWRAARVDPTQALRAE